MPRGAARAKSPRAGEFFDVPRCIPELQPACLNAAPLLKAQGIDVEAWLKRGVMDIWSVSDYFQLDYLKPNADLAHRYGVKFYSALAESRVPGAFKREKANNKRGLLDVDPRRTKDLDKVYFALVRGSGGYQPQSWVKNGDRFYVRPRIDPGKLFKITTGKPYVFGIEFGDEDWARFDMVAKAALAGGQQVVAELKVNGRTIAPGEFKDGIQAFPLKPGDLKAGLNEFVVTADPKFGPALAFHDFAVYLRRK